MELPIGTILIWDGLTSFPDGWAVLDAGYRGKPIKGYNHTSFSSSTPTAYAGSNHAHTTSASSSSRSVEHTHDDKAMTISTSNSTGTIAAWAYNQEFLKYCANKSHSHGMTMGFPTHTASHSHPITLAVTGANPMPAYKTAILIIKTP